MNDPGRHAKLIGPASSVVSMAVSRRDVCSFLFATLTVSANAEGAEMDSREMEVRATIERYAAAWLKNDIGALVDCYHDDFTLSYFGANALSGTHVGKTAALAVLGEFGRRIKRRLKGVIARMYGPDRGALVVREELAGRDETFETERVFVYAVRDHHLSECWVYDRDQARIDRLIGPDRAGLSR